MKTLEEFREMIKEKVNYDIKYTDEGSYRAINWNLVEDSVDTLTWAKLLEQFWVPERVPVSNDKGDWKSLTPEERDVVEKVFGGLTLLDTLQSQDGMDALIPFASNQKEEAVYRNIAFMECYTEGHELLTTKGWKPIEKIKKGEPVLQYDINSRFGSFQPAMSTSIKDVNQVVRIRNERRKLELEVSLGHTMHYAELDDNGNMVEKYTTAEEFIKLPKNGKYAVKLSTDLFEKDRGSSSSKVKDIEFKLLVSSGSISTNKNHKERAAELNKIPVVIKAFFNQALGIDFRDNIIKLATDLGIEAEKISARNGALNPGAVVYLDKEFWDTYKKHPMHWLGLNEVIGVTELLVDRLLPLDNIAYKPADQFSNKVKITYRNAKIANYVHAFLTLHGLDVDLNKDDNSISYLSLQPVAKFINTDSLKMEIVDKKTKVYGVQVPSGYLFVRAGESTIISGNCVHAKSYSTIFSTLNTMTEIQDIYDWVHRDPYLQKKREIINRIYETGDIMQVRAASVMLESFLFYSGFYTPLYFLGRNKLPNVAEIIKLIIRDESVHGTYVGYKYMKDLMNLSEEEQEERQKWVHALVEELYANEVMYTHEIYDQVGWSENVKTFIRYNANKALQILGHDPLYPDTADHVDPIVMNGLSTTTVNHDFFSQVGNGYLLGNVETMHDMDYDSPVYYDRSFRKMK